MLGSVASRPTTTMRSICWARAALIAITPITWPTSVTSAAARSAALGGDVPARQPPKVDGGGVGWQLADRAGDHVGQAEVDAVGVALQRQRVDRLRVGRAKQQPRQPQQRAAAHGAAGHVRIFVAAPRHDRRARPGAHHQQRRIARVALQRQQRPAAAADRLDLAHADDLAVADARGQRAVAPSA